MLMTAALTDELSRTTPSTACCRRAETITLLRFAGAVHQEKAAWPLTQSRYPPGLAHRLASPARAGPKATGPRNPHIRVNRTKPVTPG